MTSALVLVAVLAAGPADASTSPVYLTPRQEVVLEERTASAAWAVDSEVVEAAVRQGRVTVVGRSPGTTVVSVVDASGVRSYEIAVVAPRLLSPLGGGSEAGRSSTAFESGYDSSNARATANVDMVDTTGARSRRFHLTAVGRLDREGSAEAPLSLPSLSLELSSPGRELVLFDQLVEHSPLTVNNVSVRGAHLQRGALQAHVGLASSLLYDDLILPGRAEFVAGVGYGISRGRYTLTPSAFFFPSEELGGERGAVGSLTLTRGGASDPFRLRTEIGYGGRFAGAAEVARDGLRSHWQAQLRHEPRGFASLGLGAPKGTFADGTWTSGWGRLSLNASASLSRYALSNGTERSDAGSGSARLALAKDVFLTSGWSLGWFETATGEVRALSLPAGVAYEGRRAGVSLLYRYQANTRTNHGGSGGRFGLRANGKRIRGSAFIDGQREAPTVDFTLLQEPRLARLLAEQGLTAQTPEDVARLLSLYSPLEGQGYLEGVRVNVHPSRVQGGGDLTFLLKEGGRQKLRFHFLIDRTHTVARRRATTLASVSYGWRVAGAEVVAGYTWSASDIDGWANQGSSFQVGLRRRFEGVPRLPGTGGGAISGRVFNDDEAKGVARGMPPRAGTQVRLDGSHLAITDEHGRFRFARLAPGPHVVEAILPSAEDTFFTTPSAAVVAPGAAVDFGLSRTPARLIGYVHDDAGRPIGAVAVQLQGDSTRAAVTTDSRGRFAIATAEGDYVATLSGESLPPGYDSASVLPMPVSLRRGGAARLELTVNAHRAVAGRVLGKDAPLAEVRLVELGRTVAAAGDGSYAFRNLKPGKYTLVATVRGRAIERSVLVPEGPALLRDVNLDLSESQDPHPASASTIP